MFEIYGCHCVYPKEYRETCALTASSVANYFIVEFLGNPELIFYKRFPYFEFSALFCSSFLSSIPMHLMISHKNITYLVWFMNRILLIYVLLLVRRDQPLTCFRLRHVIFALIVFLVMITFESFLLLQMFLLFNLWWIGNTYYNGLRFLAPQYSCFFISSSILCS